MRIEHGKIEGDIQLDEELILHGMVTGNITILKDGVLTLHGTCCKNIIMEKGARATLHGTVGGDVLNNEGYLEVYGTIAGSLHTINGHTFVDPNAVVNGNRRTIG